jgi:hypothetical protein
MSRPARFVPFLKKPSGGDALFSWHPELER